MPRVPFVGANPASSRRGPAPVHASALGARHPPACHVVTFADPAGPEDDATHDLATRRHVAQRLASLLLGDYAGEYDATERYDAPVYFVPAQTLLLPFARARGIDSDRRLFGGVVPHAFVATKAISHGLIDADAYRPEGWSPRLAEALAGQVLPGYTVFDRDDARRAGAALLAQGPVRIKSTLGVGGRGQCTATSAGELAAALEDYDAASLCEAGLVLERHLEDVVTFSVGRLRVGRHRIAYHGTQRLTRSRGGQMVYGGSDLVFVRGGWTELQAALADEDASRRDAVARAVRYDAAVGRAYPQFFASRRNYDVALGRSADGNPCAGVLEQSWRIGGASPAELSALEAFAADHRLRSVRASTHEVHALVDPPEHASVSFRGEDPRVGPLTKYALVDHYGY